ncbi:MAG: DUF4836 family protein [Bacteroidetes bacterium]|nr:DUF4836 family protein [Bacteroidota bacterium]
MKKLLFFLLASIIFCVSCTQSSKNTLLIPAKSAVIAAFDVSSLAKKAQLKDIDALKNESMLNEFPVLRELVKNPANTGIDLKSDVFVFYVMHNENSYVCANIPLKNQKQAQEFVETKLSENFEAEGKQRFYAEEYHTWIVLENNTMLVVSSETRNKATSAAFVNYLTTLPKSESIADNEHFKTFCKNKNDIGIFISTTPFLENLKSFGTDFSEMLAAYKGMYKDLSEADLHNNYFTVDVDFKKNEVEINYSFVLNEQLENYLLANNFSKERFSNELLQFAHATSMLAAHYSFDIEKTLAYLQNIPEFLELTEELEEELEFSIGEILSSFGGDFLVSFYDLVQKENEGEVPLIVAVASVKNEGVINTLLQQKFADFEINASVPYYDFSKGSGIPFFVAVYHNTFMIATDKNALAALAAGGFENTLNNEFASSTDDDFSLFLNLDFATYPERANMYLDLLFGENFAATMPFKSLLISSESSSMTSKMVLTMKNGDDNSLAQILQFITSL